MIVRFSCPEFELQTLTVRVLPDGKIVIKFGHDQYIHYTLHPGSTSGALDIHKTDERFAMGDPQRYETVALIPKTAIEEELLQIDTAFVTDMLKLWRPLRLGWMIRRRLVIGPRLPSEDDLDAFKGISIKAGPVSCTEPIASWMKPPEFYEEILECPGRAYWLFDGKKQFRQPCAVTLAYRDKYGSVGLVWAQIRDFHRWVAKWEPMFLERWEHLHSKATRRTA